MPLGQKAFENIVGKGENAGNQHFIFFPQSFLLMIIFTLWVTFILPSANGFNLDQSKIMLLGKELNGVI